MADIHLTANSHPLIYQKTEWRLKEVLQCTKNSHHVAPEFYRGPLKTTIPKLFFAPCDRFLWLRCQQLISHRLVALL